MSLISASLADFTFLFLFDVSTTISSRDVATHEDWCH